MWQKARFPARKQMGAGTTVSQSAFMYWNDQDKQATCPHSHAEASSPFKYRCIRCDGCQCTNKQDLAPALKMFSQSCEQNKEATE